MQEWDSLESHHSTLPLPCYISQYCTSFINLETSDGIPNLFLPIVAGKLTGNLTHLSDQTNVGDIEQHFSPMLAKLITMVSTI